MKSKLNGLKWSVDPAKILEVIMHHDEQGKCEYLLKFEYWGATTCFVIRPEDRERFSDLVGKTVRLSGVARFDGDYEIEVSDASSGDNARCNG